ncbi:probable mitochondrial glutathione transporter SLC25A39 [Sycon ciliatum]|uniref:probable mitochondrial glutathione transporter SLC25A39 n=1 Tax=Sycon ciliatum TaxID=27933 RepID=UPI0031F6A2E2
MSKMPKTAAASTVPYNAGMASRLSPVQQIISASSGAALVSFFTTPFDVVKVRLQAHQKTTSALSSVRGLCELCLCGVTNAVRTEAISLPQISRERYTSFQMVKTIAVGEGPRHLWRGLSASLVMAIPATVIYYTAYDMMMARTSFNENRSNLIYPIVCGSSSRSLAVLAICPIEMIRTKMQSQALSSHRGLKSVLKEAIQLDGVWSLWRGMVPMLWRDVPFSAIYWCSYEVMKSRAVREGRTISTVEAFTAGAAAGTTAAILTNPFDVVKTYWQVEVGDRRCKAVPKHPAPTVSMGDCMGRIVNDHGVRGLFVGLAPRVSKVAPACAIMISSYEFCKTFFHERNSSER